MKSTFLASAAVFFLALLGGGCTTQYDVKEHAEKAQDLRIHSKNLAMLPQHERTVRSLKKVQERARKEELAHYHAKKHRNVLTFMWYETLEQISSKLSFAPSSRELIIDITQSRFVRRA